MKINFRISALENNFNHLFSLDKTQLSSMGAVKMVVDANPGYPCRVSLEDAEIGEEVMLFSFQHHKTKSPYKSNGPIFVRKNATTSILGINEIPEMLFKRLQSLRVYDSNGMMIDARTLKGTNIRKGLNQIFSNKKASYVHIHNANPGCYNCQVTRVD